LQSPAVIGAASTGRRLHVNFFARVLPDIRDPEVTSIAIEAGTIGVSQSIRPNLVFAGFIYEWIRRRDGVVARGVGREIVTVDVDPQLFAHEVVGWASDILSVASRLWD
jgi:hypothetical protein